MKTLTIRLILLALAAVVTAPAAQFNAGFSFHDDTNNPLSVITSNRMRLLIEGATVRPEFISAQSNLTAQPATNDALILYRAGDSNLARVTVDRLLVTNLVGAGLTGGNQQPLAVRLDTNVLTFGTSNAVTVRTDLPTATLSGSNWFILWATNTGNWARATLNEVSNSIVAAGSITTNKLAPTVNSNLLSGWAVYEAAGDSLVAGNGLFAHVTNSRPGQITFVFAAARSGTNYFITALPSHAATATGQTNLVVGVESNAAQHVTLRFANTAGSTNHPRRVYISIIGN